MAEKEDNFKTDLRDIVEKFKTGLALRFGYSPPLPKGVNVNSKLKKNLSILLRANEIHPTAFKF
jgi:hypothetical protein